MASNRIGRINEEIQRELASLLRNLMSKCDAALLDVRAGNVDLQHIDRLARQFFHYIDVIFRRFSTYIDDNLRIILT